MAQAQTRAREPAPLGRRALVFALALVVGVAALVSGRSYLWCIPMQQAMAVPCCTDYETLEGPAQDARPDRVFAACCDDHEFGALPSGASPSTAVQIPPALFRIVELVPRADRDLVRDRWELPLGLAPRREARQGPSRAGPRSGLESCTTLQVFRC